MNEDELLDRIDALELAVKELQEAVEKLGQRLNEVAGHARELDHRTIGSVMIGGGRP
jgi:prefoldin subunit 5